MDYDEYELANAVREIIASYSTFSSIWFFYMLYMVPKFKEYRKMDRYGLWDEHEDGDGDRLVDDMMVILGRSREDDGLTVEEILTFPYRLWQFFIDYVKDRFGWEEDGEKFRIAISLLDKITFEDERDKIFGRMLIRMAYSKEEYFSILQRRRDDKHVYIG